MKKILFISMTFCIIFSVPALAFDIDAYCKEVADAAGGSYQIEETCRKMESEAKAKLEKMSIPSRVEKYCKEIGEAVGGSYQIMETCVKQELESKSRMKR